MSLKIYGAARILAQGEWIVLYHALATPARAFGAVKSSPLTPNFALLGFDLRSHDNEFDVRPSRG
jgi:hypothetical protein